MMNYKIKINKILKTTTRKKNIKKNTQKCTIVDTEITRTLLIEIIYMTYR